MAKRDKQAVILIHGIGEQRPMDALRSFVAAVWTSDTSSHHAFAAHGTFSKPDDISDSFELRRLTTTKNRNGVRTDFFELYWAHLMEGTSLGHVYGWAFRLLWRRPSSLPRQLLPAWVLLFGLALAILFFALNTLLPVWVRPIGISPWVTALLGLLATWFVVPVINGVVGDAARYLDPAPANIGKRQAIRAAGVEVLQRLHRSGEYDRIVLVGHSLGSVIGYDILTHLWARRHEALDLPADDPVLAAIERHVSDGLVDPRAYRRLQRRLFALVSAESDADAAGGADAAEAGGSDASRRWLVSDFLTLGSPLAHAELLLAGDVDDLLSKQRDRELPTCPPMLEGEHFSFEIGNRRRLHHAAVFAPTRWTNLFFPARGLLHGDIIGGPVAPRFGAGVLDVALDTDLRSGLFSHTLYWTPGRPAPGAHIVALREALDLLDHHAPPEAAPAESENGPQGL